MRPTRIRTQAVGVAIIPLLLIALVGCDLGGPLPTAAPQINPPSISGYTKHDGADIIQKGATTNNVLALIFDSNPQFAAAANLIANLSTCANDRGIARFAVYTNDSDHLAAGLILIVSKTKLSDGRVLLSCITPGLGDTPGLSPCQNAYDFSANGENFWAYYAATKQNVCTDFDNALPH